MTMPSPTTHLLECFERTLEDARFTRSEKRAINQVIREMKWTPRLLEQIRAGLFSMARHRPGAFPDEWIEEALRCLPSSIGKTPISKVFFSPGEGPLAALRHLIQCAGSSIDICVFTITDDRITSPILDAHQRGVRVRIISDNHKAEDSGSDIYRLARMGVPLRHDCTSNHMHHKFALIDGNTLVTGSYNWTRSAADKNHENILVTDHPHAVRDFKKEFNRIWEEFSSCNT